ncbi:cysteine protease [Leptospira sp. 2 VSF19]|uniref:Cysteine protease n=1 Tax=Leptospira soteropolitanensis TaxID=2950025 RepID=A0AAW5V7J4_9LEPT|nr:C1 family peptidase [Leptospira soteropolitanensis]MCW7491272.1 cysteine protease [Leptospira soteropolitanensis]MCW7498857.1 cysteine protease [Leptospira soteropolitanensis]MCW7521551.1 cysteine protease [Leptospira soteropolitanensis]MCW7524960.1 cysteine protease [Leptospira soteropolitanensis]MCW7528828.1 cysteine protease [Leptospira soteropolitanensis]
MNLKPNWKVIGLCLVISTAIFAEDFDPSSVRSPGCKPGTFSCGYIPSSKEIQDSIPLKRDFNSFDELPKSVDLSSQMPPVGNQGRQNSCVAWATGYAIKSYLLKNKGQVSEYDPPFAGGKGNFVFSPAFIYNQQNGGEDKGLYYYKTMEFLKTSGVAPWSSMPYSDKDYLTQPSQSSKKEALKYKIKSFSRLNFKNPDEIKRVLVSKNVVMVGMIIDDAFYKLKGSNIYDENGGQSYGGHAMTIVGYDDNKKSKSGKKGAFKLQNSWGTNWGDKGFGWVSYSMLAKVGQETYAIIDEPKPQNTPNLTTIPTKVPLLPPNEIRVSKGEFDSKIILTWKKQDLAVAYLIQRKDESEFYDLAYSDIPSFTDISVSPNSKYVYKIVSISAEEVSDSSLEVEGFTAAESNVVGSLGQVVGLNGVVYVSGTMPNVELSWSELDGANSYTIARADSELKWKNIGTSKTSNFIDSSPKVGESNYYRVSAILPSKQSSDWSDSVIVDVADQNLLPNQVSHLTATNGEFANKIVLNWNAAPGAKIYYLYRFDERAEPSGQFEITGTSFTDTDLTIQNGKPYLYTIISANDLGYAEPSEVAFGKTDPVLTKRAGGVSLPPPKKLTSGIFGKDKLISLKWDLVKDSFEYYIYRKQLNGNGKTGKFEFVSSVEGNKNSYSETFPGKSGDLFLYSVRSKSEFGSESKDSNFVSVFWNEPKVNVKKRAFSLEELPASFVGTWTSMYWNPKMGPQTVGIEIAGNGQDFIAKFTLGDKDIRQFKGTWIPGSQTLRANGFLFELSKSLEGNSLAQFQSLKEIENGVELSFSKEK